MALGVIADGANKRAIVSRAGPVVKRRVAEEALLELR